MVNMKTYACCKQEKHHRAFPKCRTTKSGLYAYCRVCHREKRWTLRMLYPEREKTYSRKYRERNPTKRQEYNKAWEAAREYLRRVKERAA